MSKANHHEAADDSIVRMSYTYDAAGRLVSEIRHHVAATQPCMECGGSGAITLLTSRKACKRCAGTGVTVAGAKPPISLD